MRKYLQTGLALCVFAMTLGFNYPAASAAPSESKAALQAPVNLNKASAQDLTMLKGIGPKIAERIVAYRQEKGPFKTPDQLVQVKGIGDATFEKIKERITV